MDQSTSLRITVKRDSGAELWLRALRWETRRWNPPAESTSTGKKTSVWLLRSEWNPLPMGTAKSETWGHQHTFKPPSISLGLAGLKQLQWTHCLDSLGILPCNVAGLSLYYLFSTRDILIKRESISIGTAFRSSHSVVRESFTLGLPLPAKVCSAAESPGHALGDYQCHVQLLAHYQGTYFGGWWRGLCKLFIRKRKKSPINHKNAIENVPISLCHRLTHQFKEQVNE